MAIAGKRFLFSYLSNSVINDTLGVNPSVVTKADTLKITSASASLMREIYATVV